jgi:uncharacterized protein YcfL
MRKLFQLGVVLLALMMLSACGSTPSGLLWTRQLIDPHEDLGSVSCPSASFCMAVGGSDAIVGRS